MADKVDVPPGTKMIVFYKRSGMNPIVTDENGVPLEPLDAPEEPDRPKKESGWVDPKTAGNMPPLCFWFLGKLYCIGS